MQFFLYWRDGYTSLNCWLSSRQPGCCRRRRLLVGWAACLITSGSPVWRTLNWVGTEKEKLNRALNYYLRSFQSLKHTYHLQAAAVVGRLGCVSDHVGVTRRRGHEVYLRTQLALHIGFTEYKGIYNVRTGFVGKEDGELTAKMCGSPHSGRQRLPCHGRWLCGGTEAF